ncbi:MAG: hypothetical protein ABFD89_03635 [Bryobacteraceae bacterium]
MADKGRNNGVTGLVDITGTPQFFATVRAYTLQLANQSRGRQGRGQGRFSASRPFTPGGSLVVSGVVRQDVPPQPSAWRGETGTITLQFNTGVTQAIPVRVDAASYSYSVTGSGEYLVSFTCTITGDVVQAGFGTSAPSPGSQPATTTVETYDGTQKTYDPDGLLTGATRTYDVWGTLDDTDAAELALILSALANTAPITGLKGRVASVQRTDSHGCVVIVTYSLTTSGEDQLNSHTSTSTDDDYITNQATTAAWIGDPPTPTGTGWVHATTQTIVFNGIKTLTVWTWALRTPLQGIEQDGSVFRRDDTYGIEVERTILLVTDSETPPTAPAAPTGTVAHEPESRQLNNLRWSHTFRYTPYTAKELIEWRGTSVQYDPSSLGDEERITLLATSLPSTPTPTISGLVLRDRIGPDKTNSRTYFAWTFIFTRRTRETEIEQEGSQKQTDPGGVRYGEVIRMVTDSATEPTWSTSVSGVEKRSATVKEHAGRYIWTGEFGDQSTLNELKNRVSRIVRDSSAISDEDLIASTSSTSTQPGDPTLRSGLKVVGCTTEKVNEAPLYLHVFRCARANAIDKIEAEGTRTTTDPNSLEQTSTITDVDTSATQTPPTAPTGTVHVVSTHDPIPGTSLYIHKHVYGPASTKQQVEYATEAEYLNYGQSQTRNVSVVDDSVLDVDTFAGQQFLTYKASPNFFGVSARRKTPDKIIRTIITGQEEHTIEAHFRWWEGYMPAVLDGGTVKVRVGDVWETSGSDVLIEVVPEYVGMVIGEITITTIRTHVTEYIYQTYLDRLGTVNPSEFIGFSRGLVRYIGSAPAANLRISVPRKDRIAYRFQYCSLGHWNCQGIALGERWVTGLTSSAVGTLVAASTISASAAAATEGDSFGVFLP